MEMRLKVKFLICKEVNKSSLFDWLVLLIDSYVLELFFSVSQMLQLSFFSNISPWSYQLLGFVSGIDIVEDCEFGSQEVSEMSDFNIAKVKGN